MTITGQGFTSNNTILLGQTAIHHVPVLQTNGTLQTLVFTVPEDALLGPYNVLVQNATGFSNPVHIQVVRFQALGFLPGAGTSPPFGVSADGSTAVGGSGGGAAPSVAFRWTAATGIVDLGTLPGASGKYYGYAWGVNADGSVVVGFQTDSGGQLQAFRWTPSAGMVGLGFLPGRTFSSASASSSDGSVIVGTAGGPSQAFRWSVATGMVPIDSGTALGVNSLGTIVVGDDGSQAFVWTAPNGAVQLGVLPGGTKSCAYGVSADGSVVVGRANNASGVWGGFRWTASTGMVAVGFLPGGTNPNNGCIHQDQGPGAYGVCADGRVVVGWATDSHSNAVPYRWTSTRGLESIPDLLVASGVNLTGWTLTIASGVSADGTVIVGMGTDPAGRNFAGWIARLPLPPEMKKKH